MFVRLRIFVLLVVESLLASNNERVVIGPTQLDLVRVGGGAFAELQAKRHRGRALAAEVEERVGSFGEAILREVLVDEFAQETKRANQVRFPNAVTANDHVE